MAANYAVETTALSHSYGQRLALDAVNLQVPAGAIFGLLGPNGGGKTTLFRILTTLLQPTGGTARVAGADVITERPLVRRRLGIVFQHPSLDDKLTVMENLIHQGHLYGLSGHNLQAHAQELLLRFGLGDRARERVSKLSGGLQRRVELAKALLHRPPVIILDEPSSGLDPGARADLMHLLRELRDRDGVTCLLTTHLMDEAANCDRVAILDRGLLVACDTPAALTASVGGEVITVSTRSPAKFAADVARRFNLSAKAIEGQVYIERPRGLEFIPALVEAFPGEIDAVTVGRPTLDHVFLRLTGHRLGGDDAANN